MTKFAMVWDNPFSNATCWEIFESKEDCLGEADYFVRDRDLTVCKEVRCYELDDDYDADKDGEPTEDNSKMFFQETFYDEVDN